MNKEQQRKRIGSELRDRRMEMGMTQQDIQDATGIRENHVSRIERGYYSAGFDNLEMIAEAMDAEIKLVPKQH